MSQSIHAPPVPKGSNFLFAEDAMRPDGGRDNGNATELATRPEAYIKTDALSQIERLCGCSVVSLLRIDSDGGEPDDVLLHNSQLRVALTELLALHYQCSSQVAHW